MYYMFLNQPPKKSMNTCEHELIAENFLLHVCLHRLKILLFSDYQQQHQQAQALVETWSQSVDESPELESKLTSVRIDGA